MNYFVTYGKNDWELLDGEQLKNFTDTAVVHNKDIAEYLVIGLDSRLREDQVRFIGGITGFSHEINECLKNGDTPFEAVMEWLK